MAFDERTAERVREALRDVKGIAEKRMFGGLAFLVNGNMCCGVVGPSIMLRLGADGAAAALHEPNTRAMDFTGRAMKSMVYVDPAGFHSKADLEAWVKRAVTFASALPAKVQ